LVNPRRCYQSNRRSQSRLSTPEAIAFFFSTQDVVTSRIGGANHAFLRRRLSHFFFVNSITLNRC
jgi:hypothetical protein